MLSYFNPRSRMGSDTGRAGVPWFRPHFNPRSRMGSDPACAVIVQGTSNFNPRSRMGSDYLTVDGRLRWRISIHAPAWGATGSTTRTTV